MGLLVVDLNTHQVYTAAPDATLPRLIRPTSSVLCRSDKAFMPHPTITALPDATLPRLIRPTSSVLCRSDKAFTPHPAITALPDAITLRR
ncbi:hypothetical protein BON69_05315 [Escherichia coli]|nr:hypothetical protein BE930_15810 [Escherichia coli]OOH70003.1 hypothetical protein BMU01_13270 [Escherichia coli]QRF44671.1 hypothetical protein BW707_01205 [Escherichia coli]TEZ38040.1 hypothetical protein BON69_05315 [Escherichia coli]